MGRWWMGRGGIALLVAVTLGVPARPVALEAGATGVLAPARVQYPAHPAGDTQIYAENQHQGSTGWESAQLLVSVRDESSQLREDDDDAHRPASPAIKPRTAGALLAAATATPSPSPTPFVQSAISGYADATSINKGGSIKLFVSTDRPTYRMEVYRMGWYGGAGARLLQTISNMTGQLQPVPPPDTNGMVDARWSPAYTLQTDATWTTGVYLVKLITDSGSVGYIIFVVRDDSTAADILYEVPTATYQAYNFWGGKSLYDFNSGNQRAYKVSYNRPYAYGSGSSAFFSSDYSMIRWLESHGYSVTYATSEDVESNPGLLANRKMFLSTYHDEYWSRNMRDHLTAARDQGKHLAWFDSNNMFWQTRYESDAAGHPDRVLVCYRDATLDPIAAADPALTTVEWRDAPVSQPENGLLGVMYTSFFTQGTSQPWIVKNAGNWIYQGTGLTDGQAIDGLMGWEYDNVYANGATPAGLQTLASSPVLDVNGNPGTAEASVYTAASGAIVFSAGTNYWATKLDTNDQQPNPVDPRVQEMTANIINLMIGLLPPPPLPQATQAASPTPTPTPGGPYTIYHDDLSAGWHIPSGNYHATVDLSNAAPTYAGAESASFTLTGAWGEIDLHYFSAFQPGSYATLQFAAQAAQPTSKVQAVFYDNGAPVGKGVSLADYGGQPPDGAWRVYTIPLAAFGLNGSAITDLLIQDATGQSTGLTYYVDEVDLAGATGGGSAPPSATATPARTSTAVGTATIRSATVTPPVPSPSATPSGTATPVAAAPTNPIYLDADAPGWANFLYHATINLSETAPVYSGARSASFTLTAQWGELDFHAGSPLSLAPYATVHFAARAAQSVANLDVRLFSNGKPTGNAVRLEGYGGQPSQASWKVYNIPLAAFGVGASLVSDIVVQDQTNPAIVPLKYYIDEVGLS
jgi:hypothetical protein